MAQSRCQSIYLHSEIGSATTITGLALFTWPNLGQNLSNWTIRMKHTTLSLYTPQASLDATGWTTVYRGNQTLTSTGWVNYAFSTPFAYNGADNLMVDFSFNNVVPSTYSYYAYAPVGSLRTAYASSNNTNGNPLNWSGTTSPSGSPILGVPSVQLTRATAVTITPTVSGSFTGGVWTGNVTVNQAATGVYLRADDGSGHAGNSNTFNVAGLLPVRISVPYHGAAGLNIDTTSPGLGALPRAALADAVLSSGALNLRHRHAR